MTLQVLHGVIESVQGQNPGPASGITYTVLFNMDGGIPVTFEGVRPHNTRYPDELDIQAAKPGTVVSGVMIHQELQLTIIELPDFSPCPGGAL